MALTIRHEVVGDLFCTFNPSSSETLPVAAGTAVKVVGMTTDGRTIVDVVSDAQNDVTFGFLMQKIKAASAELPPGMLYRGDLGSSDAFLGDPVGVAHGEGAVYEVDTYVDNGGDGIAAGIKLYVDDDGKLEDTNADSGPAAAITMQALSAAEAAAGIPLRIKALI